MTACLIAGRHMQNLDQGALKAGFDPLLLGSVLDFKMLHVMQTMYCMYLEVREFIFAST